jgi:hypothetical protein
MTYPAPPQLIPSPVQSISVPSHHPPSPLASKRRRLDAAMAQGSVENISVDPCHLPGDSSTESFATRSLCHSASPGASTAPVPVFPDTGKPSPPRSMAATPTMPPAMLSITSPRTRHSLDLIEVESHQLRLQKEEQEQSGKQTMKTYRRHLKSYVAWWERTQADVTANDPTRIFVPAMPITAAKVTLFLQHESTREKVSLRYLSVPVHSHLAFRVA